VGPVRTGPAPLLGMFILSRRDAILADFLSVQHQEARLDEVHTLRQKYLALNLLAEALSQKKEHKD
jgi:hypothetical protein